MKNPYKTTSSKLAYKSKFLQVREDQVLDRGKKGLFSIVFRKNKGGVAVIARNKEGNFYLVKQWRYPIDKETIEFITGKIDKNETPLRAAKREMLEELGLFSKSWISLGKYNESPGFCNIKIYVYLANNIQVKRKNYQNYQGIEEYTEMIRLSETTLKKYMKSGKIQDSLSLAAYTKYLVYKNKIK